MRKLTSILLTVICSVLSISTLCLAQQQSNPSGDLTASERTIDSLKAAIETADHSLPCSSGDTVRIKALNQLSETLMYSNPDTAIILGKQALDLSEETEDQKNKATTLSNLGVSHL